MTTASQHSGFLTTRWSLVAAAGGEGMPAAAALAMICETYWFPLYAFIRRQGTTREEAEDLTQGFFMDLLERSPWDRLAGERGRFRAFLLAALKHYLANERDAARCQKRGGGAAHLPLDWQHADARFQLADAAQATPDQAYDREWGLAVLAQVLDRLRQEAEAAGERARFEQLREFLSGGIGEGSYQQAADVLGMEAGTVRVAVHRLRKRYRRMLREEIARTLGDPAMVEEELRSLSAAFR
jgi:RNA polymerase sigma factor (sigma-70 family)